MGDEQVTVKNLEVVMLDGDTGVVAISGAVPGPPGGLLRIIPRTTAKSG
jgi:large subunit ribosomal protein L3